ncbi:MAG: CBS domain-containing protein [Schwartzia sp.]|nr:CBS domain-containing protein [Schwartzia sp. (in: firmicutes)]MBR1885489.1 CBS domain-containing protein [Schwartzia sp. (in: firmicutes)]
MLAKDIMETKVITLRKEATIKEIGEMMIEHGISGFPVVDGENRVLGVVSELDLMRKEIKPNEPNLWLVCVWGVNNQKKIQEYIDGTRKCMAKTADEIMTSPAITVDEMDDIETVGKHMFADKIKRVFVTKEGKLTGVISRSAFIKLLLSQDMENKA